MLLQVVWIMILLGISIKAGVEDSRVFEKEMICGVFSIAMTKSGSAGV